MISARAMPLSFYANAFRKTVQERLGHANASITLNTYAHTMVGDDQKAVDVIEQRLRSAIDRHASRKAN